MPRKRTAEHGFPRVIGEVPQSRGLIEDECRRLWEATSDERKREWELSYTVWRRKRQYYRPAIDPDDVFGPDAPDFKFKVRRVVKPLHHSSVRKSENREKTLIASGLGMRWAFIIFDPLRSGKDIREDILGKIGELRQMAQKRHPTKRRPGSGIFYVKVLAYYHRLSGKTRAETAERILGRADQPAMKQIDKLVESFLDEMHPRSRLVPVE